MAVVATSTNGSRAKVELALNESCKLKLLKDKAYEGQNSFGSYYLYTVEHDSEEKVFFATPEIHNTIIEAKLKTGDEFILRKSAVQNGKKLSSQVAIEFVERQLVAPQSAAPSTNAQGSSDGLNEILLQCVIDAAEVIRNSGVQLGNDELQKLATTLFIARTR